MKYVSVVIDRKTRALDGVFTYSVPDELCETADIGCCVSINFHNKECVGFIVEILRDFKDNDLSYKILSINDVLSEPYFSNEQAKLALWVARKYVSDYSSAIKLLLPPGATPKFVKNKDGVSEVSYVDARPKKVNYCVKEVIEYEQDYTRPDNLTREQNKALSIINKAIDEGGQRILIDGVTGSGKTEVYLQAIEKVLKENRNAIVLVPEISLTPQTVARFSSRFGDAVAVLHSKMTPAQRRHQWFFIKDGGARVVIGPRSALFAPLDNVGIVVIDEEHETSYKQESAPRYDARAVSEKMMEEASGTLILGSATPSLTTLYSANEKRDWHLIKLRDRPFKRSLPSVEIVDMRREFKSGKKSMFSLALRKSLVETLSSGNKAVLLLNQRGFATHLTCTECGFVPECPNCAISLKYHEKGNILKCHHCGYEVVYPVTCPKCGSVYLSRIGCGTEKVEAELKTIVKSADLTNVSILRMDADTTKRERDYVKILKTFKEPGASVLLGTQMIAKGLDVSQVTLSGVINADTTMYVPDYAASEKTYDLIEQVAGRAGRDEAAGKVIVQSFCPDNPALHAAKVHDRKLFLAVEIPKRQILKYPPYVKLVNVIISGLNDDKVASTAHDMQIDMTSYFDEEIDAGLVLSCANKCSYSKLNGKYRYHILMKVPLSLNLTDKLNSFFRNLKTSNKISVVVDVDPSQVV